MHIGVLGTGTVGHTLAQALVDRGHEVRMGARAAGNEKAVAWAEQAGPLASEGTFADAAAFGELIINATAGVASLAALESAGTEQLAGKVLVDVSNPLDFSQGMPPKLTVCNDDSLAEQIQAAFPEARVVKTLNTVNCEVMVDPGRVRGDHSVFVCGNDDAAKAQVVALLSAFGWHGDSIVDLGDLSGARGTEMYLPLWLRIYGALGSANFNISIAH